MSKIINIKKLSPKIDTLHIIAEEYKNAREQLKRKIQDETEPKKIEELKKQLNEYEEIEKNIENIILRTITNDQLEAIYRGEIQSSYNKELLFAVKTSNGNLMVVIEGQGLQEITDNKDKEKYSISAEGKNFSIEIKKNQSIKSEGQKKQVTSVFFAKDYLDEYFDTLIKTNRINRLKDFNFKTEYTDDVMIKETRLSQKNGSSSVGYLEIFENANEQLPDRLIFIMNTDTKIYKLNPETGKYSIPEDEEEPEISLEEFEEDKQIKHGIRPLTKSLLNKYFNEGNFVIPKKIKQVLFAIEELEKQNKAEEKSQDEDVK